MRTFSALLSLLVLISLVNCSPEHIAPNLRADRDRQLKAVTPDFKSIYTTVIQPLCVSCHSGSRTPHGIDLSSYDSIVNNNLFPPLVVRFNPDSSSLVQSLVSGRMPKDSPPLPKEAIDAIREWIFAGALEDDAADDGGGDGGAEPPDENEPPDDERPD